VTAFGKLVRSTAFRLTLVYLVVFALYAAALLAYFALNTGRLMTEQITETVTPNFRAGQQYTGGLRRLILIIENRSCGPAPALLRDRTGRGSPAMSARSRRRVRDHRLVGTVYRRPRAGDRRARALARGRLAASGCWSATSKARLVRTSRQRRAARRGVVWGSPAVLRDAACCAVSTP
jgi:hypothetical protein